MANKYTLTAAGVHISYTTGATIGIPVLTYTAGAFVKHFTANEITSDDTGLGHLISIPLLLSVDTGGKRFGFFLPYVNVAVGKSVPFHSIGIYETFTGPNSIPHRPSVWRCIEMTGVAEEIIVPL